jgi:phosphohistidine phosphatase SixA
MFAALLVLAGPLPSAFGAALSGHALVAALQKGGYVLVMRHASSPTALPDANAAEPDNAQHERQLDATGKDSARAMGDAIRALNIPIGSVLSSPTYRARETLRFARLPEPRTFPELGDAGQNMQAKIEDARAAFLRTRSAEPPRPGTDNLIVTHGPNMQAAFGRDAAGLADGEAIVFRPDGHGHAEMVARVKIADWPRLAAQH